MSGVPEETYVDLVLREFRRLKRLADQAMTQVEDGDFFASPASEDNSIAVNRQLTHYAYHVGQIVFVARHFAGESWQSLSVPKGKSKEFNFAPTGYLADGDG